MNVLHHCQDAPRRELEAGETLYREGERPHVGAYVLESGALSLVIGAKEVYVLREPGSLLGELAVMAERPYIATAVASEPSVVCEITDLHAFLAEQPEAHRRLSETLARRLDALVAFLVDLQEQMGGPGSQFDLLDDVIKTLVHLEERREGDEEPEATAPVD